MTDLIRNYIILSKETDTTLKIVDKKEVIDVSIDRILRDDDNIGVSTYLTAVLNALLFKNKQKYFCKELVGNYSNVFDFNGDEYSCLRLFGTYKKDFNKISDINNQKLKKCKNCWCRNFCKICVAEVLLGFNDLPFAKTVECNNARLYDYAFLSVISIFDKDKNVFQKLINNYLKKYLN